MASRDDERTGDRSRRVEHARLRRAARTDRTRSLKQLVEISRIVGVGGGNIGVGARNIGVAGIACYLVWRSYGVTPTPFVLVLCVAAFARNRIWMLLRRTQAKDGSAVLAYDPRPPILYLRPFSMDGARVRRSWSSRTPIRLFGDHRGRYEEWLSRRLRAIGPFVTLGDPTEGLPQLGAVRFYAHDDAWRTAVSELLGRAGTIILHVGDSPGLAWEIERIVLLDEPSRVLLSLPLGGGRARERRYTAFRARFGAVFPHGLPEDVRDAHFLYFDADWTPRPFGELGLLPPLPVLGHGEQRALVLRKLAPEFKRMWAPRWTRLLAYAAIAALLLCGFADPGFLLLAVSGVILVAMAAAPGRSPVTLETPNRAIAVCAERERVPLRDAPNLMAASTPPPGAIP